VTNEAPGHLAWETSKSKVANDAAVRYVSRRSWAASSRPERFGRFSKRWVPRTLLVAAVPT
jgi:hypothetical protein